MPEEQKKDESAKEEKATGRKIELDEETYSALLDKLDELETRVSKSGKQKDEVEEEEDDVESLAREGKEGRGEKETNIDDLTNAQLLSLVEDKLTKDVMGPVMVAINQLRIEGEIDRLTRPKELGGEGIKDFWSYKDEIYQIASQHPKMTLKRAYLLAKSENPEKGKGTEKANDARDRDARLRHLPERPQRTHSERPGMAESSSKEGDPKTLKDAAAKAYDEVFSGRKDVEDQG